MRRFCLLFGPLFVLAMAHPALAASNSADAAHLHVELVFPHNQLYPGGSNAAGLYFKLERGWHVYWQNAGDSGEPPRIRWTLPDGVTAGTIQFPPPTRLPLGPLMDFGYENEVLFPFSFQVADSVKEGPAVLHAKVNWLVCREVCIPGKAELDESVQLLRTAPMPAAVSGPDQALWNRLANNLPQPLPAGDTAIFQSTPAGFRLAVSTGQREAKAEFYPEDQNILSNPAPQPVTPTANGLILELTKDPNLTASPAQLRGVLELTGGRNYEIAATPGAIAPPPPSFALSGLLRIAGFAFLGGLLLNLMPCVFPVLFLKGLALVNSGSEERHKLRVHGLVYTTGIVVSFWALVAVLLGLRAAGASLGWGFQFQSPVFLFLLAGFFFLLGLSLAGQFEMGLSLTSAGGTLAAKQGYAGSFFTGVLAVIVATPCTAPFMGAAIGYALAQPAVVTFAVFTALALGLAVPYVALTLQPAWTHLLPKPGTWMDVLKQAVSLFMFGTVVWLTWVVAQAYGATLLAVLLSSFLLLAVAGWFLGRWPAKRWSTIVALVILLGFAGISVYAPRKLAVTPPDLNSDDAHAFASLPSIKTTWQPWSAEGVQRALAAGQPAFVDFTASWCLTCQVNERVALDKSEVMQAFGEKDVVLFKADWTRQDPAITQALSALGRSGVPVYALYSPGQGSPQLLPQVLTPGIVIDAVSKVPARPTGNRSERRLRHRASGHLDVRRRTQNEGSGTKQPGREAGYFALCLPALILRISSIRAASCFSRPSWVGW
jgi:thiol:disulfide interchange protein